MKNEFLPKDLTVLILLTVSDISDPINFYERSDLVAILFVIDTLIDVTIINRGVNAKVIRAIFQQLTMAMISETTTADKFKQTIAITPVIMLCIW